MTLANFAILLGCLGLGMTVLMYWWDAIATELYRRDLAEIVASLDRAVAGTGGADDLGYLGLRLLVTKVLIPDAPSYSLAAILIRSRMRSDQAEPSGRATGIQGDETSSHVGKFLSEFTKAIIEEPIPEVSAAASKIFARTLAYVFFGSILNAPCLLSLGLTGGMNAFNQVVGRLSRDFRDAKLIATARSGHPLAG